MADGKAEEHMAAEAVGAGRGQLDGPFGRRGKEDFGDEMTKMGEEVAEVARINASELWQAAILRA